MRPRQPLHFTHGYVWMPLFLFGIPALRDGMEWALRNLVRWLIAWAVGALATTDNALWVARQVHDQVSAAGAIGRSSSPSSQESVSYVPNDLRALYREMSLRGIRGVLLCDDRIASYLAASYTQCRPYLGHFWLTPDFQARLERVRRWFVTGRDDRCLSECDLVLTRGPLPPAAVPAWERILRSGGWSLYRRRVSDSLPRPASGSSRADPCPARRGMPSGTGLWYVPPGSSICCSSTRRVGRFSTFGDGRTRPDSVDRPGRLS